MDEFLDDEKEENVDYVSPSYIETTLSKEKKQECRDIVRSVNEYGISQRQKMFLIYLLTLELENVKLMKRLTSVIAEENTTVQDAKVLVSTDDTKQAAGPAKGKSKILISK